MFWVSVLSETSPRLMILVTKTEGGTLMIIFFIFLIVFEFDLVALFQDLKLESRMTLVVTKLKG